MKRLAHGGRIDRSRPIGFRWDDRGLTGFAGDTLASALLAAGEAIIGRSVILGRPRGIMAAGLEEAHGFAQIGDGAESEPLVRMSAVELVAGLAASSRITKGRLPNEPDPARFDHRYAHCDLLVVGGGPAGVAAALVGARSSARVILAELEPELGGSVLRERDSNTVPAWLADAARELTGAPDVRVLTATTATVALDQNGMVLTERLGSRRPAGERGLIPEKRLWHVRAKAIVLATGALERPIVFQDNDRPGIMLATAARAYLHRFALAPERGLVFTTNDDGYRTALDWNAAGVPVAGVIDPRPNPTGRLPQLARDAGIQVITAAVVAGTTAETDGRLRAAVVRTDAGAEEVSCDLLAVSGGFDPSLNLHQQRGGKTRWDEHLLCAVPERALPGQWIAGAAAGRFTLGGCRADGAAAARSALASLGLVPAGAAEGEEDDPDDAAAALFAVPAPDGDESRSFVDPHRDATVAGVERAIGSGIRHVEHVKRYTLIGTGVEQGRGAKVNAGAVTARGVGRPLTDIGTSSARPPVEPIVFHALSGLAKGPLFEPVRTTAIHPAHEAAGAVFEAVGQWLRPRYYPLPGESMADATLRECRAVRQGVGMMDVSTLGKIDVQGPDAARFLDRLYINTMATLEPGKGRYGVMCRQDGTVFDDGVVMRLTTDRFFVTTTTGNAAAVLDWMEEWLQTEWDDLRVWVTSVTEQWSTVAIAGRGSRDVIQRLAPGLDVTNSGFPFLGVRNATPAGLPPAMIARVSFSGELAYEISVPRPHGISLWEAVADAGSGQGVVPYGMEALHVLRAEKGYFIVGQETDGSTTPTDLGLGRMASKTKDFIGKRSLGRTAMVRPDRLQLVGFRPVDPDALAVEGAAVVADPNQPEPMTVLGHVTASHRSVALGATFGLAMVAGGLGRRGATVHARADGRTVPITLCDPVHYDPDGARRDG
ncbi:MAG: glycine cleavage T C-terminal barrel domain-containing protein [Gemmatimonadota bacterium]